MTSRAGRRPRPPFGRRGVYALVAVVFGLLLMFRVDKTSPYRYAVLSLAEHPPGTATPYVPKRGNFPPFYLVHTPEGKVHALVRQDPRSRCHVVWDEELQLFEDPCEGHQYDWDGRPVDGYERGLDRLYTDVIVENDEIFIDMSVRYRPRSTRPDES